MLTDGIEFAHSDFIPQVTDDTGGISSLSPCKDYESTSSSPSSPWGSWMVEESDHGSYDIPQSPINYVQQTPNRKGSASLTLPFPNEEVGNAVESEISPRTSLKTVKSAKLLGDLRSQRAVQSLEERSGETNKRNTLNSSTWKRSVLINAPHILLETINARTAGIIIITTYVFFITCMVIDFDTTYKSFHGNNKDFHLGSRLCTATNYSLANSNGPWGCWSSMKTWNGKIDNLSNVLLVTLGVSRTNYTMGVALNATSDPYIFYNVNLYACYIRDGCGDRFVPIENTKSAKTASSWQKVLFKSGFSQSLLESASELQLALSNQHSLNGVFFSIFQNQESLPTNGVVKSYYVKVDFMYEQVAFISSSSQSSKEPTTFTMSIASRPSSLGYNVATILLFIATVFILMAYILIMRRKAWSEWLHEQKWLVAYLVLVIMYQNPLYIIVNFHASAGGAFAAYFFSDLAQACFLVIWLFFADSIHVQEKSFRGFYGPKILLGIAIFLSNMIILSFQFPSFSPGSKRSPVEAVYDWQPGDKLLFIVASMTFLLLFWVWALIWFATIYLSKRKLGTLSYMSTRYLQLSFRFFSLQATLVTVYYILQYAATIYFIGVSQPFKQNTTTLTDNINTLFRQQTQLFGKTLFLTVYGAILAFLFLPADFMENDLANSLAAKFAVSEKEHDILVQKRKKTIRKLDALLMNQVVNINPHIFCVDLAMSLLEVAFEAYNETAENQRHALLVRQKSMASNLLPFGYTVVEIVENKELDILCLVARHIESKRLVFAFRGTKSTKNMGNNLDYAQKDVDVNSLPSSKTFSNSVETPEPGSETFELEEDVDSDDSSNGDSTEGTHDARRVKGCADFSVLDALLRCLRNALRCATTNAMTMGGEIVSTAAFVTPGLNQFIRTSVHSGFWKVYMAMRDDIHRIVQKEMKSFPAHLCFTGHSLGGALATLACWDITANALPRINQYWRHKRFSDPAHSKHRRIVATMYNFGCPRVGNRHFCTEYNKLCPNSFRVVVDGDFITSIPKTGFVHIGTEVVIDNNAAGTIIVDPSFVERWLRSKVKNSLRVHLMAYYRNGLDGVKQATEFLRQHLNVGDRRASNIIRLAFAASPRARLESSDHAITSNGDGGLEMTLNPLTLTPQKRPEHHQKQSVKLDNPLVSSKKVAGVNSNALMTRRNSAALTLNFPYHDQDEGRVVKL